MKGVLSHLITGIRNLKSLFKCRDCALRDQHIYDLRERIADLKAITIPPAKAGAIPVLSLESDAILSGSDEIIAIKDELSDEEQAVIDEASRILAGTY